MEWLDNQFPDQVMSEYQEHDGLHIHLIWITHIFIYRISWIIMYMRIALPLPQSQLQKCLIICYVMVMKNVFF